MNVSTILAVTSQLPWPLDSGGHIRSFHLLRALARRFDVRLVTGSLGRADSAPFEAEGIHVRLVPLTRLPAHHDLGRVAMAAVSGTPYVCYARHRHHALNAAVREEFAVAKPDLLYLDHLDSFQVIDSLPRVPTVIDLHNVYSTLVSRTGDERGAAVRAYLHREARLLDAIERKAVTRADAVMAVSNSDRDHFAGIGGRNVHVVPNGVDCSHYASLPLGRSSGPPLVLYVGTLSWQPNADAVGFLVQKVLPELRTRIPELRIRAIGRNAGGELLRLRDIPGVQILTDVADVRPHLSEAHVLAVPLEAGGGSRLKILEAFAAGLPVVSTPIGAEGIEAQDGTHLLLSGRSEISEAVFRLIRNPALALRLAANARVLAEQRYDWGHIGKRAASIGESIVGHPLGSTMSGLAFIDSTV